MMDRRKFLLASGAGLLATESAQGATMMVPTKLKKNVVLVSVDHGLFEKGFREGKQDSLYINKYFKDFKKKLTYFSGTGQPGVSKGHQSEHATFTCMNFQDRALYPTRQFVSLDQYIAENSIQETRHKNLFHKVTEGRNMSWNTKAQAAPAYIGIDDFHAGIFGTVDTGKVKAGISKQRVILKELKTNIKRRWKGTPQEKDLVDSIDYQLKELDTRERWLKVRRPRKAAKHPKDAGTSPLMNAGYNFDVVFEALKEKQTKVVMIQFGCKGMTENMPGLSHGYHTLTHHSYYSERTNELSEIDGLVLKSLSGFLEKLETENMLDDTIVLFTCAMADANAHSGKNIPAFLFGGGFQHKSCIECEEDGKIVKPTAMIFSSILKQVGFRDHQFSGNKEVFNELFRA